MREGRVRVRVRKRKRKRKRKREREREFLYSSGKEKAGVIIGKP